MDSKSLINETLKYLETDENKQPKYRFEIYKSGISNYYKEQIGALSRGLINLEKEEESTIPVTVYTISDVFDTIGDVKNDVLGAVSALPETLDKIKMSLKQLGYTALDTAIDTLKNAVVPIEVVQTINDVYRVARPLVEKIVDIASIMFYYESAAKVTQDILQYLSRLAVSTAKNFLDKLWGIFLDTPVFAIYENGDTLNLSGAYAAFADAANNLIDKLANNTSAFSEIMSYANGSNTKTYEPKYGEIGISVAEDIVDVCSDINTKKIYISTNTENGSKVYFVESNYLASEFFSTTDTIQKIFCYDNEVFYITNNNTVKQIYTKTESQTTLVLNNAIFKVINSNPVLLYNSNDNCLYNPLSSTPVLETGNVSFHTYSADNDIIYFVVNNLGINKLKAVSKNSSGAYLQEELSNISGAIYGISYFDGMLYVVLKENNKFYISKISAGLSFNRTEYVNKPEDNIIWIDDTYATNNSGIYTHNGNNLTYVTPAPNSINCVTRKTYENNNYFVCSGGTRIYVTKIAENNGSISYKWNEKQLVANTSSDNDIEIPDNIAGLKWYSSNIYGDFFFAYSQENIYVFGPDKIDNIFYVENPDEPEPLVYKEFKSFESWFDKEPDPKNQSIEYSSKLSMEDHCIITSMNIIDGQIYIALFSPKSVQGGNSIKCGVYKADVGRAPNGDYTISINYDSPVFYTDSKTKIYSFLNLSGSWLYTDGKKLYNVANNSETDLKIDSKEISDRALFITTENGNKVIYTAKSRMNSISNEQYGKITTLVNYEVSQLPTGITSPQIASTRNTLMFSDYNYVYNIVNNGEDEINYELFQICYKKSSYDYRLVQSCDSVFIVSKNSLKKVPLYSSLTSSIYGCGYYTDTTLNKWCGAAPYYFASNVLNEKKNAKQREIFILSFRENFKVELTKLLKNIPDAFIKYTQSKLVEELKKLGIRIPSDDGQITELILNSVASTTANSMGMYVQQKFLEKLSDETTYEAFATQVYNTCVADQTNNMTEDFYKIFEELYYSTVADVISERDLGSGGIRNSLLRYYQNHKGEWAESMTELIDVDFVKPEDYEEPLNTTWQVDKKTYRFSYPDGEYKFEYIPDPSSKFLNKNIISGYYYPGDNEISEGFYEDPEHTIEIDHRSKIDNNYVDSDGNIICYGNGEDEYFKYKLDNYVLTEDTQIIEGKKYYKKTKPGDEQFIYVATEDTYEHDNKPYYKNIIEPSTDTSVVSGRNYYVVTGGEYEYTLKGSSSEIRPGILPAASYFIKQEYVPTEDTEIDENKTYYIEDYSAVSGELDTGVQYYERKYVLTEDTEIDENKTYYEYIDLTAFSGDNLFRKYVSGDSGQRYSANYKQLGFGDYKFNGSYYIYNPNTEDTRYDVKFASDENGQYILTGGHYEYNPDSADSKYSVSSVKQASSEIDPDETYYTYNGSEYVIADNVDEQYGPYYYVDGFVEDANGYYVQSTISSNENSFTVVTTPILNNLSSYFELVYSPVANTTGITSLFVKDYLVVDDPLEEDLDTYFEKGTSYIPADDLTYVYNGDGSVYGVKNDRNLYELSYTEKTTTQVLVPSGSPVEKGWYDNKSFEQVASGSFDDPHSDGLYERQSNGIDEVTETTGSPVENGWYESTPAYSTTYDDGKVYIDLSATKYESNFDTEDKSWHDGFYSDVLAAKSHVTSEDLETAKTQAIEALNEINYGPYPSDEWQMLITMAVTEYYIPIQGEQFRQIVLDSDMYPIQWDELPAKINHRSFDYALSALLYAIKQRLLTNITILVDGGKVKCYSCVDASTVIKKIVDRNAVIWNNQLRFAKSKVRAATTIDEVKKAFTMIEAYDETRSVLREILVRQSRLYASYIDRLIEVQIINDNDTEVMM